MRDGLTNVPRANCAASFCTMVREISRFRHAALGAFAVGVLLVGCGGDTGGSTPPPSPTPTPPPAPVLGPCPASTTAMRSFDRAEAPPASKTPGGLREPDPRGTIFDVLWDHYASVARGRLGTLGDNTPSASADVGDVAVIQDEGDLITQPNTFDLRLTGLRFVPNVGGGYDVVRIDPAFRAQIGDRVTLTDDDSVEKVVPFAFTFYGKRQSAAFVNSDGNITFGEADKASTDRNIARLLTGAPRVALFLTDLDPSVAGGVFVNAAPDAFTATWCGVRGFGVDLKVTMQASLLPDGSVEMKYADAPAWTATLGIAGLSPGHTGAFQPVDLSIAVAGGASIPGGGGAVAERFAQGMSLDLIPVARKFYQTHPDLYDQLLIWTDATLTSQGFAFESTIANEITGIGIDRFDRSSDFGSAGRLRSLVQMDHIAKYPDDPATKFLGENNTLSVLGQEVGHRWLAFLRFSDHNHQTSDVLLGRDRAHWSFFFNSDASVMEGNRIEDLGGGSFKTVAAVEKYSLLDQYVMGLVRDIDVPPFFYVENPVNPDQPVTSISGPKIGVTFKGTRRDVLINDVIEAMGARQPSFATSPKLHRQAFLFVVSRGKTADAVAVAKIDRIRRAWETFFSKATDGRSRAETRLFPTS